MRVRKKNEFWIVSTTSMPNDKLNGLCGLVPVRAGSKRVINKNLRPFAGTDLLSLKVEQLLGLGALDAVYVSSDSEEMLERSAALGAVPLRRPAEFCTDEVPMSDVYAQMASQVEQGHILFTHVTNPFCGVGHYREAIAEYYDLPEANDSITSVSDVKAFLYFEGKPMNFDAQKKPRSQDLPEIVKLNHAISIAPRDLMMRQKNIFGVRPKFIKLDDRAAFDIDTELDFKIAEFLMLQEA
jgi:CMP-N,N'-diacetyllegionaminic acid synthase